MIYADQSGQAMLVVAMMGGFPAFPFRIPPAD